MKFEETEKRVRSQQRIEYLDNFLSRTPVDHPEFRDAYNERWNEFFPGHPLFTDQDKKNLARWEQKALMGLPKMPEGGQVQEASGVGSAHGGCRHERTTRHGSNAYVKVLRCKDCGVELERTKVEKPEKMQTSSTCRRIVVEPQLALGNGGAKTVDMWRKVIEEKVTNRVLQDHVVPVVVRPSRPMRL